MWKILLHTCLYRPLGSIPKIPLNMSKCFLLLTCTSPKQNFMFKYLFLFEGLINLCQALSSCGLNDMFIWSPKIFVIFLSLYPGVGGTPYINHSISTMGRSEGYLCEAKHPRQGFVFRRLSLDMSNKFWKSILYCDNSFNGLICDTLRYYKLCISMKWTKYISL